MKKRTVTVIFFLILTLSFTSLSNSFDNKANKDKDGNSIPYNQDNINQGVFKGGHDTLTVEGMKLKREVHNDDLQFQEWSGEDGEALKSFRTGAHDEDSTSVDYTTDDGFQVLDSPFYYEGDSPIGTTGDGSFFDHFYNPKDGTGLKGVNTSATQKAKDYVTTIQGLLGCNSSGSSSDNTKKANEYFGKALHLLQDMAVPSHTTDDAHPFNNHFEQYINDHWNEIVSSSNFKNTVTASNYLNNEYAFTDIESYMKTLADYSSKFPNEEALYHYTNDGGYEHYVLEEDKMKETANALVPEAIMASAAFIDAMYDFYSGNTSDQAKCALLYTFLGPGGDSPDDRFDVSDEFYWEREYKLTIPTLTDFYMRTAMKKGKISVWYKKRYMELFAAARTYYKNAPQSVKDEITAKIDAIGKSLDERRSYAQSDWKGAPDVALFSYGFYKPFISLMLKYKEPVAFKGLDFTPSIANDHPVMVIPSGGLYGFENSTFLKASLSEYVNQGGTLIVFAQQHGYEFSTLPVPQETDGSYKTIIGYGWTEDQSCFTNAVYIDTQHQMLSSISKSTPTLSVDGYFTSYPSNTTVLLRRTANGQPAMIMYEHGLGKVIVSSMYSDFAMSHNQASSEELALVRDMVAWAKKPAQLPEIKPGQTVSVSVSVKNVTTTDAASVKLYIYNPDRTIALSTQLSSVSIPAGSSAQFVTQYASPATASLGIYHIDYELYDSTGAIIQPQAETDSGRFVVSNPPVNSNTSPAFNFVVNSDSEKYAYGSDTMFTITMYNNTDTERTITAKYFFPHHWWETHEMQYGGDWSQRDLNITKTMSIPSKSSASFPHILNNARASVDRLWAYFYDENGKQVGMASRGFYVFKPSVNIEIITDKPLYSKGETVNVALSIQNSVNVYSPSTLNVRVVDPMNTLIYSQTLNAGLGAGATSTQNLSFNLPLTSRGGFYIISVEAYDPTGGKIGGASDAFELPLSQVSVIPELPKSLTSGANTISFKLNNTGKFGVTSGIINVSLKDPDGSVIYAGSQPFSVGVGQSMTLNIPVSIPSLKFGDYTLTYTESDETRTGQPASIVIPNFTEITAIDFDKVSYRIRETANIAVTIVNQGKFNLENIVVTLSVPDIGYEYIRTISIPASGNSQLTFSAPMPDTIAAGQHDVDITMTLSSGSSISRISTITIPESALTIEYSGPSTVTAGDMIHLTIQNTGGVDTTYTTESFSITDNKGVIIYEGTAAGVIAAGEKKTLTDILIPQQTVNGFVYLNIQARNNSTTMLVDFNKTLAVSGLTSTVQARTDKDVYLKTEEITSLSSILNGQIGIDGGSLRMSISKVNPVDPGQFTHFLPKTGWWPFYVPYGVAVGPDGSFFVADYGNHLIVKFDREGKFIKKWGGFHHPIGVAVGQDGFVYVTDEGNRVQKFDANGTFIAKWGSRGSGNGQFRTPYGIAIGQDGFIYVAEGNQRVQKFDSDGNFITKWGSFGSGDGQFYYLKFIEVRSDGLVYVTDYTNRVQIFDTNGNFIKKWYGSSTGYFSSPAGVATDENNIYVVNQGNYLVQKFDSNGNFITKWGSYGYGDGQFVYPNDLSIDDGGGYIYITDSSSGRVQKFDNNGNFLTGWGKRSSRNGSFYEPKGMAVGKDGSLFVADTSNHRIQKFNNNGDFISEWGGYGDADGKFNDDFYSIAVSPDGFVYIADYTNDRIQKFDANGKFISKWTSDAKAIAFDQNGYMYESGDYQIKKYDQNHNLIVQWGSYGGGDGQFCGITNIAISENGYVYASDGYRIQKFDSNGQFISRWGGNIDEWVSFISPFGITVSADGSVFITDIGRDNVQQLDANGNFIAEWGISGTENEGEFYYPFGIAIDNRGSVYVADTHNGRIQKLVLKKEIIFEATTSVNQAPNIASEYLTHAGILDTTGKLYLQAELKNNLGQTIATDEYLFYIIEGNTFLKFTTDKKIYRSGEAVIITGEVKNLATITASGMKLSLNSQQGTQNSQLFTETFDVPADGAHSFTISTTAAAEGTFILTGKVSQNNSSLAEITDRYEVASPKVTATIASPDIAGNNSFDINLELKNEGKTEANIQLSVINNQGKTIDDQQIIIQTGETKVLQYQQQITTNTTYTFTFMGDLEQTIAKTISYGLSASVAVTPQSVYPEGKVGIPVTITNTGQIDDTLNVIYSLQPLELKQAKTYYIPKGESVTDILYYDLTEGSYQLTAISSQPEATANANFSVKKENNVTLAVAIGTQNNELIPATVNLTNLGYNSIVGSVRLSVINSRGAVVWQGVQDVAQLLTLNSKVLTFNVNPFALASGDYTVKAELFDRSNQQLAVSSQPLTIKGPIFQISQLPPYQTFTAGQEANFTFKVKNTGNQEDAAELDLKAYDLIDATQREWLKPGEERQIEFSFMLPDDLETKDYFADYELRADDGQVVISGQAKYHLAGISLDVNAVLDRQNYSEGETAHLTINIHSPSAVTQPLFVRVNYAGYELQQAFTIGQGQAQPLQFEIPLTKITGEKLFYGIYHESGRSIHLNSVYIYKAGDVITITTDKQVYIPGEQVSVSVNSVSGATGTLILTAPNYEETFNFTGTATKNFTLPSTMTAGTYNINYEFTDNESLITHNGSRPFDVNGIQVKVLECRNDKGKYASSDTITTSFTISSNMTMQATLKAWIIDPEGKYTTVGESSIGLLSSESLLFSDNYSLTTAVSGIHRLVYGIYEGDMLLVSGSEAFDVGDAVLLGLSTDKADYPTNTETVNVAASLFGTVDAELELQLDGISVKTESISLNGFKTASYELPAISPGTHVLKGILTAGGLRSTKETSFVYGSSLPDLTIAVSSEQSTVSNDSKMQLTTTAVNQGKMPSNATAISLYDNDDLIETKPVNALGSGESQEMTFIWNVFGKAGEHVIKAIIDPDNTVIEFNEGNNTSTVNIVVPDIALLTGTDKDTYKIRQKVNITSTITNLTSEKQYNNLMLVTSAYDPSGTLVYQGNTVINTLQASSSSAYTETWNTSGLSAEGEYMLSQTLLADSQVLASSTARITLQKAADFTLGSDIDRQRLKQGETAKYTLSVEPLNGWSSGISLGIDGLPDGTSVSFNPVNLIPPGESLTMFITTNATVPGKYALKITAEGLDEGETVTHELPLTLDVSGFGLNAVISSQTIKQLETATFSILLDSMNGYEGEVSLGLEGLPYGIKAILDRTTVQVPGEVMLKIQSSKYIKPGIFEIKVIGDDGHVKHDLDLMLAIFANPEISEGIITTPGPGPQNSATVSLIGKDFAPLIKFKAFTAKYGAYAASADIDGDGYDEIIVAQGPGPQNTATIRVFKRDGTFIAEVALFDTKYGMTLSSGDIDGDWKDEIIAGIGPGPGNPAELKVVKFNDGGFIELLTKTLPYNLQYGLNTALGDIDGDGIPEIITSPGPGPDNPATVTIWKQTGQYLTEMQSFSVFGGTYGVNISTGDIDGDGVDEIITGTGPDPKNQAIVRAYKADGTNLLEFIPYGVKHAYGVTVASADIDEDGIDEIITGLGPGPQNPSWVKVFKSDGTEIASFLAYPENSEYGVKVFSGSVGK
jgi:sugar lactone lactonase YvrE